MVWKAAVTPTLQGSALANRRPAGHSVGSGAVTGWRKDWALPAFCILVAWTSSRSAHEVPFSPCSQTLSRGRPPQALSSAPDPGQSSHVSRSSWFLDAWRGPWSKYLSRCKAGSSYFLCPSGQTASSSRPVSHRGRVNPVPQSGPA